MSNDMKIIIKLCPKDKFLIVARYLGYYVFRSIQVSLDNDLGSIQWDYWLKSFLGAELFFRRYATLWE